MIYSTILYSLSQSYKMLKELGIKDEQYKPMVEKVLKGMQSYIDDIEKAVKDAEALLADSDGEREAERRRAETMRILEDTEED